MRSFNIPSRIIKKSPWRKLSKSPSGSLLTLNIAFREMVFAYPPRIRRAEGEGENNISFLPLLVQEPSQNKTVHHDNVLLLSISWETCTSYLPLSSSPPPCFTCDLTRGPLGWKRRSKGQETHLSPSLQTPQQAQCLAFIREPPEQRHAH